MFVVKMLIYIRLTVTFLLGTLPPTVGSVFTCTDAFVTHLLEVCIIVASLYLTCFNYIFTFFVFTCCARSLICIILVFGYYDPGLNSVCSTIPPLHFLSLSQRPLHLEGKTAINKTSDLFSSTHDRWCTSTVRIMICGTKLQAFQNMRLRNIPVPHASVHKHPHLFKVYRNAMLCPWAHGFAAVPN